MARSLANITRGRLSADEKATIEELAERGLVAGQIAFRLNRHPSTVHFAMTTMGLTAPVERQFRFQRNGCEVVSFSKEEDAFIVALRTQDHTWAKIAELVGKRFGHKRTAATIGIRLKMLAAREGR
jgi:hypothetical protein